MALLAAAALHIAPAAFTAGVSDSTPYTADRQSVRTHVKLAKRTVNRAYALSRWEHKRPASRGQRRLIRWHIRQIRWTPADRKIRAHWKRKAQRFNRYRRARVCHPLAAAGSESIRHCILVGARRYGQDYAALLRVASCESHLNRLAANPSGASGLFQFLPSTWATTPYAGYSIWNARAQGLAAAWMWSQGRRGEWVCQ